MMEIENNYNKYVLPIAAICGIAAILIILWVMIFGGGF